MAHVLLANPKRRRRAHKSVAKKSAPRRRRSTSLTTTTKVTRRRYRRNPAAPRLMQQVQGAAVGAAGAFMVDVAMSKLPIPANMKTGAMAAATQGLVSIGLGMLVGKFANKKLGMQIADGGLTVALHGALKSVAGPSVGLSGWGDAGLLGYGDSGLLGYQELNGFTDLNDGVGFLNPAPVSSGMGFYNSFDDE